MTTKTITITVDEITAARLEKHGVTKIINLGLYQADYRTTMRD